MAYMSQCKKRRMEMKTKKEILEENYKKAMQEYVDYIEEERRIEKEKEEAERAAKKAEKEARIQEVIDSIMKTEELFNKLIEDYDEITIKLPDDFIPNLWF